VPWHKNNSPTERDDAATNILSSIKNCGTYFNLDRENITHTNFKKEWDRWVGV